MAERPRAKGTLRLYESYMFQTKDPAIDIWRSAVEESGMTYQEIEEAGGPAASTLYGWFHKDIKRPQFATLAACAGAIGAHIELVTENGKRLKVLGRRK